MHLIDDILLIHHEGYQYSLLVLLALSLIPLLNQRLLPFIHFINSIFSIVAIVYIIYSTFVLYEMYNSGSHNAHKAFMNMLFGRHAYMFWLSFLPYILGLLFLFKKFSHQIILSYIIVALLFSTSIIGHIYGYLYLEDYVFSIYFHPFFFLNLMYYVLFVAAIYWIKKLVKQTSIKKSD